MKTITLSAVFALFFAVVIISQPYLFSPLKGDGIAPIDTVAVTVHDRAGHLVYSQITHNLITNAGKDFISAQIGSTTPGVNGANYIALTTDTAAANAADTTLTSEISTGGLVRAQGTYAHTTGTNTYTISKTFTASATFTGVDKAGLFTASSSGTMLAESTFSSVNLVSGDTLAITWTVTLT